MKVIDADKFLGYLIFSKHIDSLKCEEVKEAVEMCKVDVLEQIRTEIEDLDRYYDNDYFSVNNCPMYKCNEVLQIIDKYKENNDDSN